MSGKEQFKEEKLAGSRGRPRLSFVIPARNDGFMGNFKWRFETTLNYLADNLLEVGKLHEAEIVVCDWGSEELLHTAVNLNQVARQIVRFVLVPAELARRLQGDSEFPVVLAQNAAIRRCRGEYIAQTDSDILFTTEFLRNLFGILEGRRSIGVPVNSVMIVAKRYHVPFEYVSHSPPVYELDWFIEHFKKFLPLEANYGVISATALVMMHRNLWQECGGYDERLIYRGMMEFDLGKRVTSKYEWFDLTSLGLATFHLEHSYGRMVTTRKWNPASWKSLQFNPNSPDWGLNEYTLKEFVYPATRVEERDIKQEQSVRLNFVLLCSIVRVVLERFVFPRRLRFHCALCKHRLAVVLREFRGKPVTQWHCVPRVLWTEYRQKCLEKSEVKRAR